MRISLCALAWLLPCFLLADQVTLKNGDTVSGVIVKKDGDKLTLKSEFLGEVTMPWSAITSVRSDQSVYVVLPDKGQVNGKLNTAGTDVQVQSLSATVTSPLGQITSIRNPEEQQRYERLLRPGWRQLWSGYFDLGFALARGNAITNTLTTAFAAARVTNNDKTSLFFNQINSSATINRINGTTADAARGGISYQRNINPRWFYDFSNLDEYDAFQNLDFRGTFGGGLGFHAIKNDRTTLDLLFGGDYTHENFSNNLTRNLGEVNGGDDLTYKLGGITSLTQSLRVFDAPVSGEYRINFDLGAATAIRKWLSWQVTASDRYLSAPIFGRKRNDVLLTTGVRMTFAR